MKRLLAVWLAIGMTLSWGGALAEMMTIDEASAGIETVPYAEDAADTPAEAEEFVVTATTKLSGMFFTNMWGNNTCDIDVRHMIHNYSPVWWTQQSTFEINPQVVHGVSTGEYEDGNKVYMVVLHKDLTYNDGSPITAHDYVFSLMLFASPVCRELGGITTNSGYIYGSDEYLAGETDVFAGLRIVDDYTFTIEIKAEYLPFFFELGMLDAIPYPIDVIAPGCQVVDEGNGVAIRNIDPAAGAPLFTAELLQETVMDPEKGYLSNPYKTCGPYMLTDFDWETRTARFAINPYFKGMYDGAKPTIDNVVFQPTLPETMIEEYESGEVQLINKVVAGVNIEAGLELVGAGQAATENYPRMGFGYLNFSCETGPFQSEAVRKAVAYCIDEEAFCAEFSPYSVPVYGYMGIGQWMYLSLAGEGAYNYASSEEEAAAWSQLSLEGLDHYTMDLDRARQLLIDDGWVLNELGAPYDEGAGGVRHKLIDGQPVGLNIRWARMQDSIAAQMLEEKLPPALEQIGMAMEIVEIPFVDLLEEYYNTGERDYDVMYLATNFISIFDPFFVFNTRDDYMGTQNTTGYRDQELEDAALYLRQTEPGALFEYTQKWIAFQETWNEKLPMLPLYSNIYFDFHIPQLKNYRPDSEMSWPVALVSAYLDDGSGTIPAHVAAQSQAGAEGDELVVFE